MAHRTRKRVPAINNVARCTLDLDVDRRGCTGRGGALVAVKGHAACARSRHDARRIETQAIVVAWCMYAAKVEWAVRN